MSRIVNYNVEQVKRLKDIIVFFLFIVKKYKLHHVTEYAIIINIGFVYEVNVMITGL